MVFLNLLLLSFALSAVIEQVEFVSYDSTPERKNVLSASEPVIITTDLINIKTSISVKLCPPKKESPLTIKYTVKTFDHTQILYQRTVTPSSTDCIYVSSSIFADGESYFYASQGFYSIVISVHDSTEYALFSTAYAVSIVRSTSLSLPADTDVLKNPLILSFPSSIAAISVRWFVDGNDYTTTTTKPHQILGPESSPLSSGRHLVMSFIYTERFGFPEYSAAISISVKDAVIVPTSPPHIAPTVIPDNEDDDKTYCGNDKCENNENCESCPQDCGLCSDYKCSAGFCKLPSCLCSKTIHPSLNDIKSVPQFVSITWDDAQTPTTFANMMNVARKSSSRDYFGCRPKMTFFTSTNNNQYQFTKQLYREGHEVAVHSVNHDTNSQTTRDVWEKEIVKAKEYLTKYSGIPSSRIVGFRAPDLKYNDEMLSVLKENGFLYDSSIPVDITSKSMPYPYTLDHGGREQQWKPRLVTSSHPGLWEFPLPTLVDKNFKIITMQDPSGSQEEIISLLKDNFDMHYEGDRSPFMIALTGSWLLQSETERLAAIETVLKYIASKSNVVFASVTEIVKYYSNPQPISQMKASDFICATDIEIPVEDLCDGQTINTCYYSTKNFQTCRDCPDYYPGTEPDSSTIETPSEAKKWKGLVTVSDEQTWNGGFCQSLIITNPSTKPAGNFEIMLSTKNSQITTLWGLKIKSKQLNTYYIIPDKNILIKPGKNYSTAGICGKTTQNNAISAEVTMFVAIE